RVPRWSLWRIMMPALLATLFLLVLVSPAAAAPSCAPFNDPGCLFGEDFSSYGAGTVPGSPWTYNGGGTAPGTSVQAGPARLQMGEGALSAPPRGCEGCPRFAAPISGGTAALGSTYWVEFTVSYAPGFKWGCGTNCSNKVFDWRANCCSSNQRVLFTVW